jgi:hypothetical protein
MLALLQIENIKSAAATHLRHHDGSEPDRRAAQAPPDDVAAQPPAVVLQRERDAPRDADQILVP